MFTLRYESGFAPPPTHSRDLLTMLLNRIVATTALTLALAPLTPAFAGTIDVPSGIADLQTAIDAAAPGDVIRVDGGVWDDLAISTPVTIVGAVGNRPTIRCTSANPDAGSGFCSPIGAVRLAGTGSGVVQFINVDIDGGDAQGAFYCNPHNGVIGGGFDELRFVDCSVTAGEWIFVTGGADGADGVSVSVPLTVAQGSTFSGGRGGDDEGVDFGILTRQGRGLHTSGDLVAIDSQFVGGDGWDATYFAFSCPGFDVWQFGEGGDGVAVGSTLFRDSASVFEGGVGAVVTCNDTGEQFPQGDGADIVAGTDTQLTGDLQSSGPLVMGQTWTASWTSAAPTTVLALALPAAPLQVGQKGPLFLDLNTLFLFFFGGVGPQNLTVTAPTDPNLLGLTVGLQVYDTSAFKLSNPVFGTHQN